MAGFHDIIGHDDIIRHLKNAIETGKVSHSYIFTGEPGSGKKLLAGTFAAALQCESGESEPCMTCDSCKKVIGKNHPDIITVTHEKPGSISIDEVREQVVHDVDIKPYCSPYKIYIIPDAEMMTVQAQNALLKTIAAGICGNLVADQQYRQPSSYHPFQVRASGSESSG